jgi:hypothetical protein
MKCDRDWLSTRQSRTRQAFVKQALLEPSLVRPLPFVWFTSYRTCTIRVFVFCQDDVNGSTAKFLECVLIYYCTRKKWPAWNSQLTLTFALVVARAFHNSLTVRLLSRVNGATCWVISIYYCSSQQMYSIRLRNFR